MPTLDQHNLDDLTPDQLISIAIEALRFDKEVPPQVISDLRSMFTAETLVDLMSAELAQCQTKDVCLDQDTILQRMSMNSLIDD